MSAAFSPRARGLAEEPPSSRGGGDGRLAPAPATGRLLIDRPIARTKSVTALHMSVAFSPRARGLAEEPPSSRGGGMGDWRRRLLRGGC